MTPVFDSDRALGTSRFRVLVLVILLLAAHGGTMTSGEMARHLRVHAVYLRKIMSPLLKRGIIEAKEGRDGGYTLRAPPDHISLAVAFEAVSDEKYKPGDQDAGAAESASDGLDQVIVEVRHCVMNCLAKYSIADISADNIRSGLFS
ncbi:Rrf2 family transcriptional regulator [Paenibacillus sp. VCA1]|uniref:RrF2 family transcriptional regulator n=1 Tax=Paenibacillus sp. VCA1 TaxID=3039148 RepID=UPI002871B7E6|nr:Rrf2 family transcriptional regulator [Paenibacillus sp. VCA1]MDR9854020.1 Rrf2 family transcriptional regulator [Paenibacillus sp. VCA1]